MIAIAGWLPRRPRDLNPWTPFPTMLSTGISQRTRKQNIFLGTICGNPCIAPLCFTFCLQVRKLFKVLEDYDRPSQLVICKSAHTITLEAIQQFQYLVHRFNLTSRNLNNKHHWRHEPSMRFRNIGPCKRITTASRATHKSQNTKYQKTTMHINVRQNVRTFMSMFRV